MNYFDYAATTPIASEALTAFNQVSKDHWGNTSSLHNIGTKSAELLNYCRNELAMKLGVPSKGIFFTSGGTESNHLALLSLAFSMKNKGKHIITTMAEHSSVHSAFEYLSDFGFEVTKIPYLANGQFCLQTLNNSIRDDTVVISIGHTNAEIGSIQPLQKVRDLIGDRSILFHSDFVQAFGKVNVEKEALIVDSLSISSHKVYGPKGVGAVYINPKKAIKPFMPLQTHEVGFRGGTVNVPGIASFMVAVERVYERLNKEKYQQLRLSFLQQLSEKLPGGYTIIEGTKQMPHMIGLCFEGIQGQWLMLECNRLGFAISTGSACQVGQQMPSKTLTAMGIPPEKASQFIRISFGEQTTEESIQKLAEALSSIVSAFK